MNAVVLGVRLVAGVVFLAACVRASRDRSLERRRAKLLARINGSTR